MKGTPCLDLQKGTRSESFVSNNIENKKGFEDRYLVEYSLRETFSLLKGVPKLNNYRE